MEQELLSLSFFYCLLVAAVAVAGGKTKVSAILACIESSPIGFSVRYLVAVATAIFCALAVPQSATLTAVGDTALLQYAAVFVGGIAGGYFPQTITALRKLLIAVVEGGKGFVLGMLSRFKR